MEGIRSRNPRYGPKYGYNVSIFRGPVMVICRVVQTLRPYTQHYRDSPSGVTQERPRLDLRSVSEVQTSEPYQSCSFRAAASIRDQSNDGRDVYISPADRYHGDGSTTKKPSLSNSSHSEIFPATSIRDIQYTRASFQIIWSDHFRPLFLHSIYITKYPQCLPAP